MFIFMFLSIKLVINYKIINDYPQRVLIYIPVRCTFGHKGLTVLQRLSGLCPFYMLQTLDHLLKVRSTDSICSL